MSLAPGMLVVCVDDRIVARVHKHIFSDPLPITRGHIYTIREVGWRDEGPYWEAHEIVRLVEVYRPSLHPLDEGDFQGTLGGLRHGCH